ncbi:MAG: reprolysin-like metallopeptidase [Bacteroidota bacterium]
MRHLHYLLCLLCFASLVHAQSQSDVYDLSTKVISDQIRLQKNNESFSIDLPMPGGDYVTFTAIPNNLLSSALQAQYPNIRSYDLQSTLNPLVKGKLTYGDGDVYCFIQTPVGMVNINSSKLELGRYNSYIGDNSPDRANEPKEVFDCKEESGKKSVHNNTSLEKSNDGFAVGASLRNYRVVIVTTAEFYIGNGSNLTTSMTLITNIINGWNLIYNRDAALSFTLVGTQIYTDPNTDPFDPTTPDSRTNQAAEGISLNFNTSEYDLGQVFDNTRESDFDTGGVAQKGSVCDNNDLSPSSDSDANFGARKGGAWSGGRNNIDNVFLYRSAHEAGHQFDASHSFNGTGDSCTNGIEETGSYEIGSGNTIMGYNGICQDDNNIPGGREAFFHANSLNQIISYINSDEGGECGTEGTISNTVPVVNADPCNAGTLTIPVNTPFTLTAEASDADGDPLLYNWEQYNEDDEVYGNGSIATQGKLGAAAASDPGAPLFRNYAPTSSPSRTFPRINEIASGNFSDFEVLPTVARSLNFALTVRDGIGGSVCTDRALTVSATGPLVVNDPANCGSLTSGGTTTITWNTNGSDVLCADVDILLSVDGGLTYPYLLASGITYASGTSGTITIPNSVPNTSEARFKVVCSDNSCATFFNINASDCSISTTCSVEESFIAPDIAMVIEQGDAALDLGLANYFGNPTRTVTVDIDGTEPSTPRPRSDSEGTTVCETSSTRSSESFTVVSLNGGTYGVSCLGANGGFFSVSIFEAVGFDINNPCSSTFLGSNTFPNANGGTSRADLFYADLQAGVPYVVIAQASSSAFGVSSITFSGTDLITEISSPSTPYDAYTFIAVDQNSDNIAAQSSTADFTALNVGKYIIYGVSYETSIDPSTWVGTTLSSLLASSSCLTLSTNNKILEVTFDCEAEGATFSPDNAVVADAGDPSLDLSLTVPTYVSEIISFSDSLKSTDTASERARDDGNGNCVSFTNDVVADQYNFQVETTGSYQFDFTVFDDRIINIYQGSFDPINQCANWLASSADNSGGSTTPKPSVTVNLTAGTQYVLVVTSFSLTRPTFPAAYTVIPSPSNLGRITQSVGIIDPGAEYSYTFIIVDDGTGNIVEFADDPDLSNTGTYPSGMFTIYGLSYKNTDNSTMSLNTAYAGSSFAAFQMDLTNQITCGDLSDNTKSITINAMNNTSIDDDMTYTGMQTLELCGVDSIRSTASVGAQVDLTYSANEVVILQVGFEALNGCTFTARIGDCLTPLTDQGVEQRSIEVSEVELTVYPNPTSGMLNLTLSDDSQIRRVSIFDTFGRLVQIENNISISISLNKLTAGVYILLVEGEEEIFQKRIIKQ